MLIQSTVGRLARLFEQPQLVIVAVKRILKGANQSINGLLSLSEIAICFDMQAFEGHGGEFQERFIVLLQRFAGQRLKRFDEFVAGMIDQGSLFHQPSRGVFHSGFSGDPSLLNHCQLLTDRECHSSFLVHLFS